MLKIYDTLKNLISPELISKASATLGESNAKVSTAVSAILPSLLGKFLKDGDTVKNREIIESAGRSDVYNGLHNVFTGNGIFDNINIGERFESALLGNKTPDFVSAIASKAGITTANADRLTNWVAAAIAGYLGHKVVNGSQSMSSILGELESEKNSIMNDIPSNIFNSLGLSSVFGTRSTAAGARVNEPVKKKSGNGWIIWLIICLLLLLLLFFWWRSCNRGRMDDRYTTNAREMVDTAVNRTGNALNNAYDRTADAIDRGVNKVRTELTLPDGKKINVYKGGCEDKMISYLNSDNFKNASAADLGKRWFELDNIEFEFNSANKLTEGSMQQLNNIAAILKNYPDIKVRIGGNADRIGSDEENMEISEERAEYVKSVFERNGVNGNRIDTRGFGEEFAQYAESAPDSLRVNDRNIALRFTR